MREPVQYCVWERIEIRKRAYLVFDCPLSVISAEILTMFLLHPDPSAYPTDEFYKEMKVLTVLSPLITGLFLTEQGVCYAPCAIDPHAEWDDLNLSMFHDYGQLAFFSEPAARAFYERVASQMNRAQPDSQSSV